MAEVAYHLMKPPPLQATQNPHKPLTLLAALTKLLGQKQGHIVPPTPKESKVNTLFSGENFIVFKPESASHINPVRRYLRVTGFASTTLQAETARKHSSRCFYFVYREKNVVFIASPLTP